LWNLKEITGITRFSLDWKSNNPSITTAALKPESFMTLVQDAA